MYNGWIVYSKKTLINKFGNNAFIWMNNEAKKNKLNTKTIFIEDLHFEINCSITIYHKKMIVEDLPDFILLRYYDFNVAKVFETLNIPLFNTSDSLNKCRNKWFSHLICINNNIPTPKTLLGGNMDFNQITESINTPFIIKELVGSKGEQVYLINSKKTFLETLNVISGDYLIQEFIKESEGKDVRVHVIGSSSVVAIERIANKGFKSNFSLGGSAREYQLTEEISNLCVKTCKAHGLDIAGIDLLMSHRGPLVCEVNGISAFRTVAINTDVNIPNLIFNHIHKSISHDAEY